jgi:hypothetical protein
VDPQNSASSSLGTSRRAGGSDLEIRHVGKDPMIKLSMGGEMHIALWSKVFDDESGGDEWACLHVHIAECFQLSDSSTTTLSYVDEDQHEITLSVLIQLLCILAMKKKYTDILTTAGRPSSHMLQRISQKSKLSVSLVFSGLLVKHR